MNSRVNQDVLPTNSNQSGGGMITHGVRRNSCIYMLLLGAVLGMLIGTLNLFALNNRWNIPDFFYIVDAPIRSLIGPFYAVGWTRYPVAGRSSLLFRMGLVLISYWAVIGLFLGSFVCLVRIGVTREMARDRISRHILFFASCVGMFIGSLSFLAASNGWNDLDDSFDLLNRPVYSVMDVISYHFDIQATAMQKGFICWHVAAVIYWAIIGLFAGFIFCVIRILKKRRTVAGTKLSEE